MQAGRSGEKGDIAGVGGVDDVPVDGGEHNCGVDDVVGAGRPSSAPVDRPTSAVSGTASTEFSSRPMFACPASPRQTWPRTAALVTGCSPLSRADFSRRHIARSPRPAAMKAPASYTCLMPRRSGYPDGSGGCLARRWRSPGRFVAGLWSPRRDSTLSPAQMPPRRSPAAPTTLQAGPTARRRWARSWPSSLDAGQPDDDDLLESQRGLLDGEHRRPAGRGSAPAPSTQRSICPAPAAFRSARKAPTPSPDSTGLPP